MTAGAGATLIVPNSRLRWSSFMGSLFLVIMKVVGEKN